MTQLSDRVADLCRAGGDVTPLTRDFCALLRAEVPHYHWLGVYVLEGGELVLKGWDGPAATQHVRIPVGEGICGLAAREDRTVTVDDVSKDPRYLECFLHTKSEIVVPIRKGGRVIGEIDIDSDRLRAFDETDRRFLEWCAERLAEAMGEAAVRPAVPQDAAGIARVHVDSWRTTYRGLMPDAVLQGLSYKSREEMWARTLQDAALSTFVAEESGRIVGFSIGGRDRGEEKEFEGELISIYLLASHQGRGLGRRLTLAVVDRLLEAGMRSMIVWVLRENPACRFYESLGGKLAGTKTVTIGGAALEHVAYGWTDLQAMLRSRREPR